MEQSTGGEAPETRPVFKTPEEALATLHRTHAAIARATDGTPSTVVRAFVPDRLSAARLQLPPVTMRRWILLEKIKSPFLASNADDLTMEDLMRTFFVLVQPTDAVSRLLAEGDAAFTGAVDAFADTIPLSALGELSKNIGEHLAREFEPQAEFVREEEAGGGPKPKASSATEQGAG